MLSVVAPREVEYVDDVFPLVPQRSSMLSYLELCKPGAVGRSHDTTLTRHTPINR